MSPVPRTADAIARGRAVFVERCVVCHGPLGRGDGSPTLSPPPADLVLHVPQHPDGELYWYVTKGSPGTAMPAWEGALTSLDRWSLVHYLRELAEGRP